SWWSAGSPGGIAEHAIGEEAIAEVLAFELVGAERIARSEGHVADGALGVGSLPLEVVALIEVEPRAAADRPAHLVGRMAANLGASQSGIRDSPKAEGASEQPRAWGSGAEERCAVSGIVAAADVMRRNHDLGTAPGLVDAPVLHDVREPGLRPIDVERDDAEREVAEVRVDDAGLRERGPGIPRLFEREGRREAVAILRGIGKDLPATVAAVARGRTKEGTRRRRIEGEERLRGTDREPGELDERPVRAEVRVGVLRAVVVHADLEVATQGPVLGLLPAVEPRVGAGPHQEVGAVEPVLHTRDASKPPVEAARAGVIEVLTMDVSADLEADIGARDVVEAVAVKGADLHVLHRRCLDRHVGGLRPSDRNKSRGRPEEKTFHHLHLNLHMLSWEGLISSGAAHPGRSP